MDAVEQPRRVLGLVGLEPADEVKLDPRMGVTQGGPFVLRFLYAVLAEMTLAFGEQRLNRRSGMGLTDGYQRYLARVAARNLGCLGDPGTNVRERSVCHFHGAAL